MFELVEGVYTNGQGGGFVVMRHFADKADAKGFTGECFIGGFKDGEVGMAVVF